MNLLGYKTTERHCSHNRFLLLFGVELRGSVFTFYIFLSSLFACFLAPLASVTVTPLQHMLSIHIHVHILTG